MKSHTRASFQQALTCLYSSSDNILLESPSQNNFLVTLQGCTCLLMPKRIYLLCISTMTCEYKEWALYSIVVTMKFKTS